ncbi:hypothetical protein KKI24_08250 [bacterium]|nr:hypothetical protein [bacterium]
MKNKKCYSFITFAFILCVSMVGFAAMQSEHYKSKTSVESGGGGPVSSTNYNTNSTIGQSSPVMDPEDPPWSDTYTLYPGFWYTIEKKAANVCECDLNTDGRCDMQDWLLFGSDWGRTDCGTPPGSGDPPNDCDCDLNQDGRCDMQDWLVFGEDWGRTDCP